MKDLKKSDKKNITYIERIYGIVCTNVLPGERSWFSDMAIDKLNLTSKSERFE